MNPVTVPGGPARDLIGYEGKPATGSWPGGVRLAVSVVVNYEEGSERSIALGDPDQEQGSEWGTYLYPAGVRNLAIESMFEYGSRVGIWRLLDLLKDQGIRSTFFACALALEQNPAVARAIVDHDHGVVSHGYRWEEHFRMSREEEKERIEMALASFEQTLGYRPRGWYCRYGPSINTRELLVENGGFDYDCDAYNDDQPYFVDVHKKKHLVIPYTPDANDFRFWQSPGLTTGNDFFEYLKDSFDTLYAESESAPKLLSIGLHPRIIGRPGRIGGLKRFLEYSKTFTDVAYLTRDEIAESWLTREAETK